MALTNPSMLPFQLPGESFGIWFWLGLALAGVVDLLVARAVYRDARSRDLKAGFWALIVFATLCVAGIAYLVIRRTHAVVAYIMIDPRSNVYVRASELRLGGLHVSQLAVPAVAVAGGAVLVGQLVMGPLDFFAYLFLLLGALSLVLAYFTFHLRAWAWRGVASVLTVGASFAVLSLIPFTQLDSPRVYVVVMAIVGGVVMSFFKVDFNVGPAYLQYLRERFLPKGSRAEARNPDRVHCPSCGSEDLFVADDGSAFCNPCRKGFQKLRP